MESPRDEEGTKWPGLSQRGLFATTLSSADLYPYKYRLAYFWESLFLWNPLLQNYNPTRRPFWGISLQDTLILDLAHCEGQISAHPDTIHKGTLCSLVLTSNISSWSKQLQALGPPFQSRVPQDEVPLPLLWPVSLFSIPPCFYSSIPLTTGLQPWKPGCRASPCLGSFLS